MPNIAFDTRHCAKPAGQPEVEKLYKLVFTPVIWVRLNRLKASAKTSSRDPSVMLNRRERRMSRYQIFGCLKALRGNNANRFDPPEPFAPPWGVFVPVGNPQAVGVILPLMFPVLR